MKYGIDYHLIVNKNTHCEKWFSPYSLNEKEVMVPFYSKLTIKEMIKENPSIYRFPTKKEIKQYILMKKLKDL